MTQEGTISGYLMGANIYFVCVCVTNHRTVPVQSPV